MAFSGLNQYFVGLYQVNIIMPQVTPGNSVPLQIQMGGITSPASLMCCGRIVGGCQTYADTAAARRVRCSIQILPEGNGLRAVDYVR